MHILNRITYSKAQYALICGTMCINSNFHPRKTSYKMLMARTESPLPNRMPKSLVDTETSGGLSLSDLK